MKKKCSDSRNLTRTPSSNLQKSLNLKFQYHTNLTSLGMMGGHESRKYIVSQGFGVLSTVKEPDAEYAKTSVLLSVLLCRFNNVNA